MNFDIFVWLSVKTHVKKVIYTKNQLCLDTKLSNVNFMSEWYNVLSLKYTFSNLQAKLTKIKQQVKIACHKYV